jgi:hypothetical protein
MCADDLRDSPAVRRSIVTFPHPTTGVRAAPQELKKDYDEWSRRQAVGVVEEDGEVHYPGEEMERESEEE